MWRILITVRQLLPQGWVAWRPLMRRGFWRGDGGIKLIDNLGDLKHQISEFFTTYARSLSDCLYADIRIEMSETVCFSAAVGFFETRRSRRNKHFQFRVIAGGG